MGKGPMRRKDVITEVFGGDEAEFGKRMRAGDWVPVEGRRGWYVRKGARREHAGGPPPKVKASATRQKCQVRDCDVHGSIGPWGLLCPTHLRHARLCAGCGRHLNSPELAEWHWQEECVAPPQAGVRREEPAKIEGLTPYVHPVSGKTWHLEWKAGIPTSALSL